MTNTIVNDGPATTSMTSPLGLDDPFLLSDTALIIVDVQIDFCRDGALAVPDADDRFVSAIAEFLRRYAARYGLVIASRDDHYAEGDNGGHFSAEPDNKTTWVRHCVRGTRGAQLHPLLPRSLITYEVYKGHGEAGYSAFQGATQGGTRLADLLRRRSIRRVHVLGIEFANCVKATTLDSAEEWETTLLNSLTASFDPDASAVAAQEMMEHGVLFYHGRLP